MSTTIEVSMRRLKLIADQVRRNAQRLVCSIGNYHGTNDFAADGDDLPHGFVLQRLQRDLEAIMVIRAYALLAQSRQVTDATLLGALKIVQQPGMDDEIGVAARQWIAGEEATLGRSNEARARKDVAEFVRDLPLIDTATLKKHRDGVLAHSTTRAVPAMLLGDLWKVADAALIAADQLTFFALGRLENLRGNSIVFREQSRDFWRGLRDGERD